MVTFMQMRIPCFVGDSAGKLSPYVLRVAFLNAGLSEAFDPIIGEGWPFSPI